MFALPFARTAVHTASLPVPSVVLFDTWSDSAFIDLVDDVTLSGISDIWKSQFVRQNDEGLVINDAFILIVVSDRIPFCLQV